MTKIITDTTACFPNEIRSKYNIPVVPQIIHFGNESYKEELDIDHQTFMQRLTASKELPKTSAPPPELFSQIFSETLKTEEHILCIHPSADVSGTIRSVTVAANDFPENDIRIIDTRTIASPLGTLVTIAAQMADEGTPIEAICEYIDQLKTKSCIYFVVESLDFLAKGGRIGGASALVGSLLQIKPILIFEDGKVDQYERERTHNRAVKRLITLTLEQIDKSGHGYPTVLHADVYTEAQSVASDLASALNLENVPIYNMPPAIVTHAGPKTIGVGFFKQ